MSAWENTLDEYENILAHMQQHKEYRGIKGGVRQWLLDGAKRESARTIYEAVKRMPEDRLLRRLAYILAAQEREE